MNIDEQLSQNVRFQVTRDSDGEVLRRGECALRDFAMQAQDGETVALLADE